MPRTVCRVCLRSHPDRSRGRPAGTSGSVPAGQRRGVSAARRGKRLARPLRAPAVPRGVGHQAEQQRNHGGGQVQAWVRAVSHSASRSVTDRAAGCSSSR